MIYGVELEVSHSIDFLFSDLTSGSYSLLH